MSRYYFNENPQVTALNEVHEKGMNALKQAILIVGRTYRKRMSDFNKLPWYKKMFFKFKI